MREEEDMGLRPTRVFCESQPPSSLPSPSVGASCQSTSPSFDPARAESDSASKVISAKNQVRLGESLEAHERFSSVTEFDSVEPSQTGSTLMPGGLYDFARFACGSRDYLFECPALRIPGPSGAGTEIY